MTNADEAAVSLMKEHPEGGQVVPNADEAAVSLMKQHPEVGAVVLLYADGNSSTIILSNSAVVAPVPAAGAPTEGRKMAATTDGSTMKKIKFPIG